MTTRLEKPVRRVVHIRGVNAGKDFVVTIDAAGVTIRELGKRSSVAAAWKDVYGLACRRAGDELHREQLRTRALSRIARAAR